MILGVNAIVTSFYTLAPYGEDGVIGHVTKYIQKHFSQKAEFSKRILPKMPFEWYNVRKYSVFYLQ
jgi:hypothetical protein